MDFREDIRAQNIGDQFLLDPAILVNPVTAPGASTIQGGRALEAPPPIDRMPLYVRTGSILPLGPDVEYAAEKSGKPIEVRVYRGANGAFTLYEDENDTYSYEKGACSTILFSWEDATRTLTIAAIAPVLSRACSRIAPSASFLSAKITELAVVSRKTRTGRFDTQARESP